MSGERTIFNVADDLIRLATEILAEKQALETEAAGLRDNILLLQGQLEEANRQAEHAESRCRGLECDNERLREDVTELKASTGIL